MFRDTVQVHYDRGQSKAFVTVPATSPGTGLVAARLIEQLSTHDFQHAREDELVRGIVELFQEKIGMEFSPADIEGVLSAPA
jgi:type III secretion system FlhB-like substrate exporter